MGPLTMARAALPSVPGVNLLPGIRKTGEQSTGLSRTGKATTVTREHVTAFAQVCGFPEKDTVPLPYPHLMAFPLQMAIMADPGFPAPVLGMIHLENSITTHRPLLIGETVTVTSDVGPGQPHRKGTAYHFRTLVRTGGETVWEEHATYLRRGAGDPDAPSGSTFPDAPPRGVVWRLPSDLGRRYAAVSGDHNLIHLHPLTAKAFGFPRHIAHGMWTMARCVAALENRLPDAVRVDVAFKKPVLLPGSVAFGSAPVDGGYAFSLTDARSGAPHVVGRTSAL